MSGSVDVKGDGKRDGKEGKPEDGEGKEGKGSKEETKAYESKDCAAVETRERLRFPYPAYSDVVSGKR
jgi:hypothetical protein